MAPGVLAARPARDWVGIGEDQCPWLTSPLVRHWQEDQCPWLTSPLVRHGQGIRPVPMAYEPSGKTRTRWVETRRPRREICENCPRCQWPRGFLQPDRHAAVSATAKTGRGVGRQVDGDGWTAAPSSVGQLSLRKVRAIIPTHAHVCAYIAATLCAGIVEGGHRGCRSATRPVPMVCKPFGQTLAPSGGTRGAAS